MADLKKLSFSTLPKAEEFPPKLHGFVLGLIVNPYVREAVLTQGPIHENFMKKY